MTRRNTHGNKQMEAVPRMALLKRHAPFLMIILERPASSGKVDDCSYVQGIQVQLQTANTLGGASAKFSQECCRWSAKHVRVVIKVTAVVGAASRVRGVFYRLDLDTNNTKFHKAPLSPTQPVNSHPFSSLLHPRNTSHTMKCQPCNHFTHMESHLHACRLTQQNSCKQPIHRNNLLTHTDASGTENR